MNAATKPVSLVVPSSTEEPAMVELTILMPCLNEAETLAVCIDKAKRYLDAHRRRRRGADRRQRQHRRLAGDRRGARRARRADVRRRGYGAALHRRHRGGARAATSSWATPTTATISPRSTPFVERLRDGDELVMGNRFQGGIEPGAMPSLHRYLGNPVLSFIGRLFFRVADRRFPLRAARLHARRHPRPRPAHHRAWNSPARWW